MPDLRLWFAPQAGRWREVEALLPENFNQQTLRPALRVAILNNHASVVSILLRGGAEFSDGYDHIHAALRTDSADVVRTLVEAKALVNRPPYSSRCSVVDAAYYGAITCLRLLVLAKVDVQSEDPDGATAITVAAKQGYVDIVHFLVQGKADINARYNGDTPVLIAARNGHVRVVHLLIRAKADATRATVRCLLAHVPALAAVATQEATYLLLRRLRAGSAPLDASRKIMRVLE